MGFLVLVFAVTLLPLVFLSCNLPEEVIRVELSFLIINQRNEEVLTVCTECEVAIIGFFLLPGEEYLYEYIGGMERTIGEDRLRLPFEFYGPGADSSFSEYIARHVFDVDIYDGCVYVDTFRIQ
jgi:hypothetical protein